VTTYDAKYVANRLHKRRVQNRAVDWVSGYFPSGKPAMDFRMVRYDGMPSRECILTFESDPKVIAYWEKPGGFRWTDGYCWRDYDPDYAVDLADGRRIAVEVRPSYRVAKTRFLEKLPHIRRHAISEAGYDDLELWTEVEIQVQPRLANAALIASERTFVFSEEEEHRMRLAARRIGGRATVRQLRAAFGFGERSFRAVIRLVALGELVVERPDLPLDDNAIVAAANR
jgi:hypothetical protein